MHHDGICHSVFPVHTGVCCDGAGVHFWKSSHTQHWNNRAAERKYHAGMTCLSSGKIF